MKKLKKFKRFNEGGLGSSMGAGTPNFAVSSIESDEGYKREKEQGAKNLEDIKDFFGFGKRKSAPIEERDTSRKAPSEPAQAEPAKVAETKPIETGRGKIASTSTMTDEESRADYDKGAAPSSFTTTASRPTASSSASSGSKAPKPAAPKPAADLRDMEKGMSRGRADNAPAAPKTRSPGPEDIPGTEASKGPKGELIDNSNLAGKQLAQSVLGASPALRGMGAAARGAGMLGRMLESAPKAEGRGTGKFPEDKPEVEVLRTPAVVRAKPKSTEPKPKTEAESMGLRETEPMRRAREAKEKFEAAGKSAKEAADKSSKNAADEVAAEAAKRAASKRQTPDNRRFPNKGSATPGRPKASGEFKPTGNKFDRPVGEKRGPKTDEVLEREGLPKKKGGKIPAFKKGGFVSRGDGCAQRGKTKGRMV